MSEMLEKARKYEVEQGLQIIICFSSIIHMIHIGTVCTGAMW